MTEVRKKILFVLPNFQGGGAERVFVHLLTHLDRARFEPLLGVGRLEGPYVADLPADVPTYELGAVRSRSATPSLVRLIRKLKPDIIFVTLGFGVAAAVARPFLPRGTIVVTRLGNTLSAFLEDVGRGNPVKKLFYTFTTSLMLAGAHHLVAQSDFMVRDALKGSILPQRKGKVTRIYNPVDAARISKLASNSEPVFQGPGPHLVSVGRLSWQKGYDVLLHAYPIIRRAHPTVSLTILGEGEARDELEALRQDLGVSDLVRFMGFVNNPYPWVRGADLFVLPSRYEGFSNALVESLALGTPVVATDCAGGNREVVQEGKDGWLAVTDDPESLANAVSHGLKILDEVDTARVVSEASERFGVDGITREYERLFLKLA